MGDAFLTKSQVRVLKLRMIGFTQAEIAHNLKTSRANISILERRARENIARAERTLKLAEKLRAPVVIAIKKGDDILEVPKRLFGAADAANIRVKQSTTYIIADIQEMAGDKIQGRSVTKGFELAVTQDGNIFTV